MLERIKAAVDAVTRERAAKKLLRQHEAVWNPLEYEWEVDTDWTVKASDLVVEPYMPIWKDSADGTMFADRWHRVVYYEQPNYAITEASLNNGEIYYDAPRYTYTNIDMPVW